MLLGLQYNSPEIIYRNNYTYWNRPAYCGGARNDSKNNFTVISWLRVIALPS